MKTEHQENNKPISRDEVFLKEGMLVWSIGIYDFDPWFVHSIEDTHSGYQVRLKHPWDDAQSSISKANFLFANHPVPDTQDTIEERLRSGDLLPGILKDVTRPTPFWERVKSFIFYRIRGVKVKF